MRKDAVIRRSYILEQATNLIEARGATVPLEAIAEASNVGIATLYRHIPSHLALPSSAAKQTFQLAEETINHSEQISRQDAPAAWRSFNNAFASSHIGAATASLRYLRVSPGFSSASRARHEESIHTKLRNMISFLRSSRVVQATFSTEEFLAAITLLSHPQSKYLDEHAPQAPSQLIAAYYMCTVSHE